MGKYIYIAPSPYILYIYTYMDPTELELLRNKNPTSELEPLTKPPALRMPKKDSERFDVKVSLTQQPVDETEKAM